MPKPRLHAIRFQIPDTQTGRSFFQPIAALLGEASNAAASPGRVSMAPHYPMGGLPEIVFELARAPYPALVFETEAPAPPPAAGEDQPGLPARQPSASPEPTREPPALPAGRLASLFQGHVLQVDHAGVEFPAGGMSLPEWQAVLQDLGASANLYRYPSGEAWPFILPATQAEFEGDITAFEASRSPKFELTYGYVSLPTWQFHLDTDLPRQEVEARLPAPAGFALPGVETFRSVTLAHPWPGLAVRVNLTFRAEAGPSDWDTGRWLAEEGGRIR